MRKAQLYDVKEFLKRAFSTRDSYGVFNKLPDGLAETYFKHWELIESIVLLKRELPEIPDMERLDRVKENLESNLEHILDSISSLTGRTILAYNTEEGDTLWKISKKYTAELNEVLKLNNLESIILPLKRTRLLIPLKSNAGHQN